LPLPGRVVEERVGALQKGDALVLVDHKVHTARVRLRHTYHAGATPELDATHQANIQRADDSLLTELRKLLTVQPDNEERQKEQDEISRLRAALASKEGTITAHKAEIARLNGEVERLTKELQKLRQASIAKPVAVPVSP